MTTLDALFSSPRMFEPRYVWDPTVHKHFGEDLHYFIVRLPNPTPQAMQELRSVCEDARLPSRCVYKLYGYYDGLVRVWGNRESVEELRESLRGVATEEPLEFAVHRAYYDGWTEHSPEVDDRYLTRYEGDILKLHDDETSVSDVKGSLRRLVDARLLHYMDHRLAFSPNAPLLKFYCALSRTKGHQDDESKMQEIRDAVQGLDGIKLTSVYFGRTVQADFDCLIKGVIASRDYAKLDDWIDSLYESLRSQGRNFRRTTLLIASMESPEADIVNPWGLQLGPTGQRLRRLLSNETGKKLYLLPPDILGDMLKKFETYRLEFVSTHFERTFIGLFESRLAEDDVLLEEKLSFLQRLEGRARQWLRNEILVPQLGNKWHSVVTETLRELVATKRNRRGRVIEEDEQGLPLLGLGELVDVVKELAAKGAVDATPIARLLGEDWATRLGGVAELRNKWAHGSIGDWLHEDGPWLGWAKLTRRVSEAGRDFLRLDQPTDDRSEP